MQRWLCLQQPEDTHCVNFSNLRYPLHGITALIIVSSVAVGLASARRRPLRSTIQGREALLQKFRNSSVMEETPF
jgi:hypothetical protein